MKKEYIAPAIYVENARLSAFCSGGCTANKSDYDEFVANVILVSQAEGHCYCYHGADGNDIDSIMAGFGMISVGS